MRRKFNLAFDHKNWARDLTLSFRLTECKAKPYVKIRLHPTRQIRADLLGKREAQKKISQNRRSIFPAKFFAFFRTEGGLTKRGKTGGNKK